MNFEQAISLTERFPGLFKTQYQGDLCLIDYFYKEYEVFLENEETRDFRGLIFDVVTGRVVSRPLHVFWNHGEVEETRFREMSGFYGEKIDGSMVQISYHRGEHIIASRSSLSGYVNREVTEYLTSSKHPILEFVRNNPEYTFIFEFKDPKNPIVIIHPNTSLVLLAIRNIESGEYVDFFSEFYLEASRVADESVTYTRFESEGELNSVLEDFEKDRKEGLVVWVDGYGAVKKKTPWYVESHYYVTALRPHDWIVLWSSGRYDDVAAMLFKNGHEVRVKEADSIIRRFSKHLHDSCSAAFELSRGTPKEVALRLQESLGAGTLDRMVFSSTMKSVRSNRELGEIINGVLSSMTVARAKKIESELELD